MALYRTGNDILVEVENHQVAVSLVGSRLDSKSVAGRTNLHCSARIDVVPRSPLMTIRTLDASSKLTLNTDGIMLPLFFEESQYLLSIKHQRPNALTIKLNGIDATADFLQDDGHCFGNLQFDSQAGYTPIEVYDAKRLLIRITIEVFPSKIDYVHDYTRMMEELNQEISSIVFHMYSKTYLHASAARVSYQTGAEYLSILDLVFDKLMSGVAAVVNHPRHNIRNDVSTVRTDRAKRVSREAMNRLRTQGSMLEEHPAGILQINSRMYQPRLIVQNRKTTTYDIFENRFVKYILSDTIRKITRIEKLLQSGYRQAIIRYQLNERKKQLHAALHGHFRHVSDLQSLHSMSLVFQMAPGYQQVYEAYELMKRGLELGEDLFAITPRKIHELYEYWCYLRIHQMLLQLGYQPLSEGILQRNHNGLYLSLSRDREASVKYFNGEKLITLWYNKSYNGLPTNDQRPDIVLQVQGSKGHSEGMYIFDAKYRVAVVNDSLSPLAEDINIMHRYRDAIVMRSAKSLRYKYETFGAYVLFPFADERAFLENRYYRSINEVNIGAFPMLPGSTSLLYQHLSDLLGQSKIEASAGRPSQDDYDDYAKYRLDNVMVVNVKDDAHLQAYISHHFFHMPMRALRHIRMGVEYLAFYQPKLSFGAVAGGIRYYARVVGYRTYKRGDCNELPLGSSSPEELYHRFELAELHELELIQAVQYGTRVYSFTTAYLLQNARNTHELKMKSHFEVMVYKVLRRFAYERQLMLSKRQNETYLIDGTALELLDGDLIRIAGEITSVDHLQGKLERIFQSHSE